MAPLSADLKWISNVAVSNFDTRHFNPIFKKKEEITNENFYMQKAVVGFNLFVYLDVRARGNRVTAGYG
jgi:hypothetical protein